MQLERTIKKPFTLIGKGVHSGNACCIKVLPGKSGEGIIFSAQEHAGKLINIRAEWINVGCSFLSHTLIKDGISISTIEHLLAAFAGNDIDNARVLVYGGEIPIMDGSCKDFNTALKEAGVQTLTAPRKFIKVLKEITVTYGNKKVTLSPYQGRKFTYTLHLNGEEQQYSITLGEDDFHKTGIARTFGDVDSLQQLRKYGKALGASIENAIPLKNGRVLPGAELRLKNEMAAHKVLDMIGDLALCGRPVLGAMSGIDSGHGLNFEVVEALMQEPDNYEIVTMKSYEPVTETILSPDDGQDIKKEKRDEI